MRARIGMVAALALLTIAPQAQAGTSIGTVLYRPFPAASCTAGTTWVQAATGPQGPSYAVPEGGGVITEWTYGIPESPALAGSMRLVVLRPIDADTFLVVGRGDETPVPAFFDRWMKAPARISVEAGDLIGLTVVGDAFGCLGNSNPEFSVRAVSGDPAVGASVEARRKVPGTLLNMGALVEPDGDRDGYGDETQDGCPTDGTRQADCDPPDTTITDGPRARSSKPTVRFRFNSDDAEAKFEGKLKGPGLKRAVRRWRGCRSPRAYRGLDPGKYKFKVRAVDGGGNADPTPAKDRFRIRR